MIPSIGGGFRENFPCTHGKWSNLTKYFWNGWLNRQLYILCNYIAQCCFLFIQVYSIHTNRFLFAKLAKQQVKHQNVGKTTNHLSNEKTLVRWVIWLLVYQRVDSYIQWSPTKTLLAVVTVTSIAALRVQVMSPAQTPVAKEWFIEGMVGNLGYLILISLENIPPKK